MHAGNRLAWAALATALALVAREALVGAPKAPTYKNCNARGDLASRYYGDRSLDECICYGDNAGYDCSKKHCPVGRDWHDMSTATDTAHADRTVCSGAGVCDIDTGECACAPGFAGAACDRLACPTGDDGSECSGHGNCMTISEATFQWNGRNLSRPGLVYDESWDAHKITGCVCDHGFQGFNCSEIACPAGDDPKTTATPNQNEVVRMACTADSGSIKFNVQGRETPKISYAATAAQLKGMLQQLPTVHTVTVALSSGEAICGGTEVVTTITFTHQFGNLPPIRVQNVDLALGGDSSNDVLSMITRHTVTCAQCATCTGGVYFTYDDEASGQVANDADANTLKTALEAMTALSTDHDFGSSTSISVTMSAAGLCDAAGAATTTIDLISTAAAASNEFAYGNMHELFLLNSVYDGGTLETVTMDTPQGTKENALCSNHGKCDFNSGTCHCFSTTDATYEQKWASSDGYGATGTLGECGWEKTTAVGCPITYVDESSGRIYSVCNNQGDCLGDNTCNCFDPFFGADCSMRGCPKGLAWFEEATANEVSHTSMVECSGAGWCNYQFGVCTCRAGFEGMACEKLACPTAVNGLTCSGHGVCLSMADLAQKNREVTTPYAYGNADRGQLTAEAWDHDKIYGCYCDGGDARYPYNGPRAHISGSYVNNPAAQGYTGPDCSLRRCPHGDDPVTGELREVQVIPCRLDTGTFTLSWGGSTSSSIAYNAIAATVETEVQSLTSLAATVHFSEGHIACNASFGQQGGMVVEFPTASGDVAPIYVSHNSADAVKSMEFYRHMNYTEVQTVRCIATSGSFTMTFRGETTGAIAYTATPLEVETALELLTTIQDVQVQFHTNNAGSFCNNGLGAGEGARIRFKSELGDVPPLVLSPTLNTEVFETTKGDKELVECSNRGYCDRSIGACSCDYGYWSSDGDGFIGRRGDCSYYTGIEDKYLQDTDYTDYTVPPVF
uniref:EGF-like domain-containing protein n=1 Tax=Phaeomonas parva TaxID=124430 RepID=A0A7S1XM25_9STRA|mmetsp:Transcript_16672/g.51202  ORF Transcript_16672/g.51202 Transcript_16672/m.51202 type:complete len:962 (+) Transcript_16672:403-3288(+)